MADAGIMGLGAAVIVDRQVVWMKGYGFADWQRTRPFTPNTIMNVGSIAKTFVGVAIMLRTNFSNFGCLPATAWKPQGRPGRHLQHQVNDQWRICSPGACRKQARFENLVEED
jgi:hypothetical protein